MPERAICLVVMGPSGSGKTTTATLLAQELGWHFAEADDFHPPENVAKMASGIPLTDDDRWPWLEVIRDWIGQRAAEGEDCVITCSALKRRYRGFLHEGHPAHLRFVELTGSAALLHERMKSRSGHYMPPSLLASQLAAFEPLAEEENGMRIDASVSPETVVAKILSRLDSFGA